MNTSDHSWWESTLCDASNLQHIVVCSGHGADLASDAARWLEE